MEFPVIRQSVTVPETVQDEFDERPLDGSFVLPDYCPDIAAVLKCTAEPAVLSRQVSGDRLTIDGQTDIRILYLDEERICPRCFTVTVPLSGSFTLKNPGADCTAAVTVKTDYINCRATSPRRLDIHGTVTLHLVRTGCTKKELVCDLPEESVCTRKEALCWSVPAASADKHFTVSEVLELGDNHPPAQLLLRCETAALVDECRVLSEKVIVKGELHLKNIYISDVSAGTVNTVRHIIPFSQIVDLPGVTEEQTVDVAADVVTSEVHIAGSEGTLLNVTCKLCLSAGYCRQESCTPVTDAYGTRWPLHTDRQTFRAVCPTPALVSVETLRETVPLPPEAEKVCDLWCEAVADTVTDADDHTAVSGHLAISLLAVDKEGIAGFFERTVDVTLTLSGESEQTRCTFKVLDTDYQVSEGQLELKIRLLARRQGSKTVSCLCVTEAVPDEEHAYPPQEAALKIYYTAPGETLWEVAQHCHTDADTIRKENGLTGDILTERTMLLVPYR